MANIFHTLRDAMKFSDEDDDYDDYVKEMESKERTKEDKASQMKTKPVSHSYHDDTSISSEPSVKQVYQQEEKKTRYSSEKGKVVQFRNAKELGLCVIKPTSFSDCQDISDMLVDGSAIVINLEGFDDDIAQRIMDFVSGTVYAISGKLHPISKRIYIVSPEAVNITGDVLNMVSQGGVEAPTISRDF